MARYCFQLQVRPERLAEYRERHRAVWPEMLAALRDTGWRNYSLFLRADGLLIGYVEADDLARGAGRDGGHRRQRPLAGRRWPRSSSISRARPDEGFLLLEEVFHLEDQLAALDRRSLSGHENRCPFVRKERAFVSCDFVDEYLRPG